MEKRLIVAIVLCFLVLMGWQYFVVKPNRAAVRPPAPSAAAPTAPVPGTAGAIQQQPKTAPAESKPAPGQPAAPADLTAVAGQAEKDIVVDTPLYRAIWSNKGAVLKSWTLKKYKNIRKEPRGKRSFFEKIGDFFAPLVGRGAPTRVEDLELVPAQAAEIGRYPFSLGLDDPALTAAVNGALFEASGAGLDLAEGAAGELRFVYSDGAAVRAEKTFVFTGGSYALKTDVKIWKNGQPVTASVLWGPGIGNISAAETKQSFSATHGSAVYTGGKVIRMNEGKYKDGANAYNFVDWAAYEENYFVALFLFPPQRGQSTFLRESGEVAGGQVPAYFVYALGPTEAYIGPKDIDILKTYGHDTKKVISFGFFGSIAEILLVAVKFCHKLVPNWGVAIILLTLFIKIIFFPLTFSSTKSMAKMADLAPKLKALNAKYKKAKTDMDQRRQKQEEMMKLYKENGVNPAGGCLPMLIQLPVFWGVFRMLVVAVEFRHAPFALWITDLSTKDPLLITPILMGITQFISQKMTPTSADPAQAKMMLFMPFVMTIFFINFQSGLVLYWLTSNVLQIGQQALMNHLMHRHPITGKAR
jgi:YidC/Oxa1 family membrane protein insertase